ncbi:MAG: SH3 domain-containing C40 family peptidase [Chlamydiae bacterium]|nr:SH3 domain-containing C40 family peptidase [Chlamydiota bacterium]
MKKIVLLGIALSLGLHINALLVVNEPSVIIYETPEDHAHIEDVIRYGTKIEVVEEKNGWVYVTYPGCHGWVLEEKLLEIKEDPELHANAFVGYRGAYLFKEADTEYGPFLALPFETPLEVIEELPGTNKRWVGVKLQDGQTGYIQRSQITFSKRHMTSSDMVSFSQNFMGTKYLWGGTTSFGYDCSGFVQMLYRQMGLALPRNSKQQAVDPRFVEVKKAEAGDLVFFRNTKGKVVHVGMMINQKEFIHAFTKEEAWICVSSLSDKHFQNGHFYYGFEIRHLST